ncbi:MAG: OmpA family protein [Deltaproteobacteria bacterium]|nr:OmpA family protein [Deltaproteobacteria bacterium]
MIRKLMLCLAGAALVAGCGSTPKPAPVAAAPRMVSRPAAPMTPAQTAVVEKAQEETGGQVHFEETILQLCPGIKPPQFDYDSSRLKDRFSDALQGLAGCMRDGALRGKEVLLVGRADPRGTEDYNLALGGRRADAVRKAIASFGVEPRYLDITSRGALDAVGVDEATWANDRRVDVKLEAHPNATTSTTP